MASIHGSDRRPSGQQASPQPSERDSLAAGLAANPYNPNSAAYLTYPVKHVVSSLYRRMTEPPDKPVAKLLDAPALPQQSNVYTPPKRTSSPFQPPPLTPLSLEHDHSSERGILLSRSLAEEIRLLIPPRLQLVENWRLAYSLEYDGSSLSTLYSQCSKFAGRSQRAGYVLVVRDGSSAGSLFGAYLTDAPKSSAHYYGTGECFLWRASILAALSSIKVNDKGFAVPTSEDLLELAGLPPPPSADTTYAQRMTTVRADRPSSGSSSKIPVQTSTRAAADTLAPPTTHFQQSASGTSTPDRIRFKAFPYSGINDFMIFCQSEFLSVGGGDGHYGLWLDDGLENGLSETCLTFGNEELSDEGKKFDVLGVEVWYVGA